MIRKAVLENCQTLSTLQCILKMNIVTLTMAIHYLQISRAPRVATSVFLSQEWNANTAICQTLEIHSYLLMHKRPSWELVCNRVNEQLNHFSDYNMTGAGRAETRQEWKSNLFGGVGGDDAALCHTRDTQSTIWVMLDQGVRVPHRGARDSTDPQTVRLTLLHCVLSLLQGLLKEPFICPASQRHQEVEPHPTAVKETNKETFWRSGDTK